MASNCSPRSQIYSKYKGLESSVFMQLSGHGFRERPIRDLITVPLSNYSDTEKQGFIRDLEKAIQLRRQLGTFFNSTCPRHEHFIAALQDIIDKLSSSISDKDSPTHTVPEQVEKCLDNQALSPCTPDEDEYMFFLDELQAICNTIRELWLGAEYKGLVSAYFVSEALFLQLKSNIRQAEICNPEWFENDHQLKSLVSHEFYDGLEHDIQQVYESCSRFCDIQVPPEYSPRIITDIVAEISANPQSLVGLAALFILKSIRTKATKSMRESAARRLAFTKDCMDEFRYLFDDEDSNRFRHGHRAAQKDLEAPHRHILYFGKFYAWAAVTRFTAFRLLLEQPLIPALVHAYVNMLLNKATSELPEIEELCSHPMVAPYLFWDTRPDTADKLRTSVCTWVFAFNPRADHIAEKRRRNSVITALASADGSFNHKATEILNSRSGSDMELWKKFQTEIEGELCMPNIALLWRSALKTTQALGVKLSEEPTRDMAAALSLLGIGEICPKIETFFTLFLANWRRLREKSPDHEGQIFS